MNMKKLLDLLSDFFFFNKKIIVPVITVVILVAGYYITATNTFNSYLFYPYKNRTVLYAEKREIIKGKSKKENIYNCVEELLLGPVNPDLKNYFSDGAKVISVRIEEKTVHLNFSRSTILDIEWLKGEGKSIYNILLLSIVNSICFLYKDIEKVKFYFENKEYRYLGNYGPIDNGIGPNWKILKK